MLETRPQFANATAVITAASVDNANDDVCVLCSHVFLGFTRDGQFVLSYTMQVDVSGIPVDSSSYRLQCWRFTPYAPLQLVILCSCQFIYHLHSGMVYIIVGVIQ